MQDDPSMLLEAIYFNDVGELSELLSRPRQRANLNRVVGVWSPLKLAAACGLADATRLLLDAGAAPDGPLELDDETPLHVAAAGGYTTVVRMLLAAGAQGAIVGDDDDDDDTPLGRAIAAGHDQTADVLRDAALPNRPETRCRDTASVWMVLGGGV